MPVPYTFASLSGNIPLSHLDENFSNVKAYSDLAGQVTNLAQPNITSVGTLTSLTVSGNVTANNFIGTITGNISNAVYAATAGSAGSATVATIATSAQFATAAGSAETVTLGPQPNITSVGILTALAVAGNITTAAGNVSAGNVTTGAVLTNNLLYANGAPWNLSGDYSNANVAAYLPTYTGNVTANYFIGNGSQLTGLPEQYGNANVISLLASFGSNTITTTGNVTANYFIGDGSQLTGITTEYNNSNVISLLAAFGSNTITTTGNVSVGNISADNALTSATGRFVYVSNAAPTSGDGVVGDIWYQTY